MDIDHDHEKRSVGQGEPTTYSFVAPSDNVSGRGLDLIKLVEFEGGT